MTRLRSTLPCLAVAALLLAGTGCGDNAAPPAADHTPATYHVLVNDVATTPPFTFVAGQTARVRIKFFNQALEDLDAVEGSHFGGFTFEPASLATVVRLTDHHYQFDVTGGTAGLGSVQVSFGHDEMADEHSFNPVPVTVTGGAPVP